MLAQEVCINLAKRTQHGIRALVRLACLRQGEYVQSRDLANAEDLPTKFLESILLTLRRAGLLESKVGSGGGYRLTRRPEQITILELLDVLEHGDDTPPAESQDVPLGQTAFDLLVKRLDDAHARCLKGITLESLVEAAVKQRADTPDMYYI